MAALKVTVKYKRSFYGQDIDRNLLGGLSEATHVGMYAKCRKIRWERYCGMKQERVGEEKMANRNKKLKAWNTRTT